MGWVEGAGELQSVPRGSGGQSLKGHAEARKQRQNLSHCFTFAAGHCLSDHRADVFVVVLHLAVHHSGCHPQEAVELLKCG